MAPVETAAILAATPPVRQPFDEAACAQTGVDRAKKCIAHQRALGEWTRTGDPVTITVHESSVEVGTLEQCFQDNTPRTPALLYTERHGDTLPDVPSVLTGACVDWKAFSSPGETWTVEDLAVRTNDALSLDGGPGFARESMGQGKVTPAEYKRWLQACCASVT